MSSEKRKYSNTHRRQTENSHLQDKGNPSHQTDTSFCQLVPRPLKRKRRSILNQVVELTTECTMAERFLILRKNDYFIQKEKLTVVYITEKCAFFLTFVSC